MATPMNDPKIFVPVAVKIFMLVFLIFILLFILTWTNTVPCKPIPGWCDLYYGIKGSIASGSISLDYKPKVAIVYGQDGLGNPVLLQTMMSDREHFKYGARPDLLNMDYTNLGNLKKYDLIIVEKARIMSTEKMKMFIDYVIQGGKIIWIGDAGTLLSEEEFKTPEDYYLFEDDLVEEGAPHKLIGPWARKYKGQVVLLNELLGVNYLGNYCAIKPCMPDTEFLVGKMVVIDSKNAFTYALSPTLPLYIYGLNDFALVQTVSGKVSTTALSLEFGGILSGKIGTGPTAQIINYGSAFPLIITTSKANILGWEVGKNVAYYALPPEYFAYNLLAKEHKFYSLLENMYYGMLYG